VPRDFADEHRPAYRVEPICKALQIAVRPLVPCGRQRNPAMLSARVQRDQRLMPNIERVWPSNLHGYGADKIWKQLQREGVAVAVAVARCTVERLLRRQGLRGVMRGKVVRTTVGDAKASCPLDRVNRVF
jgi:putative transposase